MHKKSLRQQMIDEIDLRGLDPKTKKIYLKCMTDLTSHYNKTADLIEVNDIKQYQLYLLKVKKLAPNSVNRYLSGVRFFYRCVMKRYWYTDVLPRVKTKRKLPIILIEEEVGRMISSVDSLLYKAVIMLMYSSALRHSEVRNLKIQDIDSDQMMIHVSDGKGGFDRKALLTPITLIYLRKYWAIYRSRKAKSDWLFVSTKDSYYARKNLSHRAIGYMLETASRLANIKKKFTHTFCATPMELIY